MPEKNKNNIGIDNNKKTKYFPLKFENKINGRTLIVKTTKFAEKLPINENIWIKYSLDDNTIEGINQGNPVNILALKYSKNDINIIIYIIQNGLFLQTILAQRQARPQKIDNKLGKIIIAIGIRRPW